MTMNFRDAMSKESIDHWPQQVKYKHAYARVGRCHQSQVRSTNELPPFYWPEPETGQHK